jgi:serine/threonine-protein kinase RsbT
MRHASWSAAGCERRVSQNSVVSEESLVLAIDAATSTAFVQAAVRAFARAHGATTRDEWSLAIAASEAATNIGKFATRGTVTLRLDGGPPRAIEICAEDDGPGFEEVRLSMRDGISEGVDLLQQRTPSARRGLGTGLGAIARAMDSLTIERRPSGGARLVARRVLG